MSTSFQNLAIAIGLAMAFLVNPMLAADEVDKAAAIVSEKIAKIVKLGPGVYEIKKEKLGDAMKIIENAMKNAIPSEFLNNLDPVPLEVSSCYGNSWNDLK